MEMRTADEIQAMADKAGTVMEDPNARKCHGQTYEEGVRAALEWVLNPKEDCPPID